MKTRIITAAVGLCVLAVVMLMFNTLVFETVVALIAIIAVHEIYKAFALGEKESHIFIAFVPYTFLVMFSHVCWFPAAICWRCIWRCACCGTTRP